MTEATSDTVRALVVDTDETFWLRYTNKKTEADANKYLPTRLGYVQKAVAQITKEIYENQKWFIVPVNVDKYNRTLSLIFTPDGIPWHKFLCECYCAAIYNKESQKTEFKKRNNYLMIQWWIVDFWLNRAGIIPTPEEKDYQTTNSIKTQQDTIYLNKDGEPVATKEKNLSELNITEVVQIGFYKNENGEIEVVKMPKTIQKVPNKLPIEITNTKQMFANASLFNQNLSQWDTSKVTNMSWMFTDATIFNQDISQWNVSNVTNMNGMFYNATVFNQDLSQWDTSKVTNMSWMFANASLFNHDISQWNVSNVTNMNGMFYNATVFNQDLSQWKVSKVVQHYKFETGSGIDNPKKLPKFPDEFSKFYFNENKENLIAKTSWGNTRNNSFIYTFKLSPLQQSKGVAGNFKFIKFYNKDDSFPKDSSYSWGDTGYISENINNVIENNDFTKYLRNVKVIYSAPNNPSNSCNIIICQDKQTYMSAVLRVNIKMGLTFYWENGEWFFQIIITHYGRTWGSASGGAIWTPLGSYFILVSIKLIVNKYL